MKVKLKYPDIRENYAKKLLNYKGIEDINRYLNPDIMVLNVNGLDVNLIDSKSSWKYWYSSDPPSKTIASCDNKLTQCIYKDACLLSNILNPNKFLSFEICLLNVIK